MYFLHKARLFFDEAHVYGDYGIISYTAHYPTLCSMLFPSFILRHQSQSPLK